MKAAAQAKANGWRLGSVWLVPALLRLLLELPTKHLPVVQIFRN